MCRLCFNLVCLLLLLQCVYCDEEDNTRSLTFVIDITDSMKKEIKHVKKHAAQIFDNITSSKDSFVNNFVLVTFQDPKINSYNLYKRKDYLDHVKRLKVQLGGDCRENSLEAIGRALEESKKGSTLFVFTDAGSKDLSLTETVIGRAQERLCQIVFMLTSCGLETCSCPLDDNAVEEYDFIAKETDGMVFLMEKDDVGEVLKYITKSMEKRRDIIEKEELEPGSHKRKLPADETFKDVSVTVTSPNGSVSISATFPNGSRMDGTPLGRDNKSVTLEFPKPEDGIDLWINNTKNASVGISGDTGLWFEPKFSLVRTDTVDHTTTRPFYGESSYLLIKVIEDKIGLDIKSIVIDYTNKREFGIENTEHIEMKLSPVGNSTNLYITEPFESPEESFVIKLKGIERNTGNELTRISHTLSPIRNLTSEEFNPKTNIKGDRVVISRYKHPLELECEVAALPKPTISWIDVDSGLTLSSSKADIEPSEKLIHFKPLIIDRVVKNATYRCIAENDIGDDSSDVKVQINPYFEAVDVPDKEYKKKYKSFFTLPCKVDAYPEAKVTWKLIGYDLSSNPNVTFSENGSKLIIQRMDTDTAGVYICTVTNGLTTRVFETQVSMIGDPPEISKNEPEYVRKVNSNVKIKCSIVNGMPRPSIRWYFRKNSTAVYEELKSYIDDDFIEINKIQTGQAGEYKCEAKNFVGVDSHHILVHVQYPPKIKEVDEKITVTEEDEVTLPCTVDGEPQPKVMWKLNGVNLGDNIKDHLQNNTVRLNASMETKGIFTCFAQNIQGDTSRHVKVTVKEKIIDLKPSIKIVGFPEIKVDFNGSVKLICNVKAHPEPVVLWYDNTIISKPSLMKSSTNINKNPYDFTNTATINNIVKDKTYICNTSNTKGKDSKAIKLSVNPYIEVYNHSKDLNIEHGATKEILCPVFTYPKAEITWYHNDKQITIDSAVEVSKDNSTLKINYMSLDQKGKYTCKIKSKHHDKSIDFDVSVTGLNPPEILKTESEYVRKVNSNVKITCSIVNGMPRPNIRWYFRKNSTAVYEELKSYKDDDFIEINKIQTGQAGEYKCEAKNFVGVDSHHILVHVHYPPKIKEVDEKITVTEEDEVTLPCTVDGEPKPKVMWKLNGVNLGDNIKYHLQNNTVRLNASMETKGIFTCFAQNIQGDASRHVTITVKEKIIDLKPSIKIVGFPEIKVDFNGSVKLICNVKAHPEPVVLWYDNTIISKPSLMKSTTNVNKPPYDFTNSVTLTSIVKDKTYICSASNTKGKDSKAIKLSVNPYIEVYNYSKDLNIEHGATKEILCPVFTYPKAEITWYHNDKQITIDSAVEVSKDNSTLKINYMSLDQKGKYTCKIKSKHHDKNIDFDVSVTGLHPPEILKTKAEYVRKVNSNVKITCSIVNGMPRPSIRWYFRKNSTALYEELKSYIDDDFIEINKIQTGQAGEYKCEAKNFVGVDSHHNILVHVQYPPKIKEVDEKITVTEEDEVTLPCTVDGEPKPKVIWKLNGVNLGDNIKYHLQNNTVRFNASMETKGIFTCFAQNIQGDASRHVKVTVKEKIIDLKPSINIVGFPEIKVDFNGSVKLICNVKAHPEPVVLWYDNTIISKPSLMKSTTNVNKPPYDFTNSVTLTNIVKDKTYICSASNTKGKDSKAIKLSVNPYIEAFNHSKDLNIEHGATREILCPVFTYPKAEITWYHNDKQITIDSALEVSKDNSTLKINNMSKDHKGKYTCKVKSKHHDKSIDFNVSVFGLEKPEILVEKLREEYIVTENDTLILECRLKKGTPKPTIEWLYKNNETSPFEKLKFPNDTQYLTLTKLKPNETGYYRCEARNTEGADQQNVRVIVEYPPKIKEDNLTLRTFQGSEETLTCTFEGLPIPEVQWSLNGKDLDEEYFKIYANNTIRFKVSHKMHNDAILVCTAQNKLGAAKRTVHLNVMRSKQKPTVTVEKRQIKVKFKSSFQLKCNVKGYPEPNIVWIDAVKSAVLKSTTKTISDPYNTEYISTLNVNNISGYKRYICAAKNSEGTDDKLVFVQIEEVLEIECPRDIEIQSGEPYLMTNNNIKAYPTPKITWYHEGKEIKKNSENVRIDNRRIFFEVKRMTSDVSGRYDFKVIAGRQKKICKFRITLTDIPKIKETDSKIWHAKGTNVNLDCSVSGVPIPNVEWAFNGKLLTVVEKYRFLRNNSLSFITTFGDTGIYTCTATNDYGDAKRYIKLNIYGPVTIAPLPKSNLELVVGESQDLWCEADGYPRPVIQWSFWKDGKKIEDFIPSDILINLEIETKEDEGDYVCAASNVGSSANITYSVTVLEKPKILNLPQKQPFVGVQYDFALKIPCEATGDKIDITWTKSQDDELKIPAESEDYGILNGTLFIKDLDVSKQGRYNCRACNRAGCDEKGADVAVLSQPDLPPTIRTVLVEKGQPAEITCDPHALFTDRILWYKQIEIFNEENILKFDKISEEDNNTIYLCRVSNVGIAHTLGVKLLVVGPPTFTHDVNTTILAMNEKNVELNCLNDGFPEPTIAWTFDEKPMYSTIGQIFSFNMSSDKEGLYQCVISNEYGRTARVFNVLELRPVTIAPPPNSNLELVVGETQDLWCEADGYPRPVIQWSFWKDGKKIEDYIPSDIVINLEIETKEDEGEYVCEASNDGSSANITYSVTVLEKPKILNLPQKQPFVGVQYDFALKIPCEATGDNIDITWTKSPDDELKIPAESEDYEIINGTLFIKDLEVSKQGRYNCRACNRAGCDEKGANVSVLSQPDLPPTFSTVLVEKGQPAEITCDPHALLADRILWYKQIDIFNEENILKFDKITEEDNDTIYLCRVSNVGKAYTLGVKVVVVRPPTFTRIVNTTILAMNENNVELNCLNDGFPEPTITWKFNENPLYSTIGQIFSFNMSSDREGLYQCVISNEYGRTARVFNVLELSEPKILNHKYRTIPTVNGDVFLVIKCDVSGKPPPLITWYFDKEPLDPSGTTWYKIYNYNNNMLVLDLQIRPIEIDGENYECVARNEAGKSHASMFVMNTSYPIPNDETKNIIFHKKGTQYIQCNLPYNKEKTTPRWYKNNKFYATAHSLLIKAMETYIGEYVCRVMTVQKYENGGKIIVSLKIPPKFKNKVERKLKVLHRSKVKLDCLATGYPTPKVIWKHNGIKLLTSKEIHEFVMEDYYEYGYSTRGVYKCEVYNDYGNVTKEFEVEFENQAGCVIDPRNILFKGNTAPLFLDIEGKKLKILETRKGKIHLIHKEKIDLTCKSQLFSDKEAINKHFLCLDGNIELHTSYKNSSVSIRDVKLSFFKGKPSEKTYLFDCQEKIIPKIEQTSQLCHPSHHSFQHFRVGFVNDIQFFNLYEICYDFQSFLPSYTKQEIIYDVDTSLMESLQVWFGPIPSRIDIGEVYEKENQLRSIIQRDDKCVYKMLHLVDPRGLPARAQAAAYSLYNVAPLWSNCNTENWNILEERIRELGRTSKDLVVWTGTAQSVRGQPATANTFDAVLKDRKHRKLTVPRYIWKVVKAPSAKISVAMILVNLRKPVKKELKSHVMCRDISNKNPLLEEHYGQNKWFQNGTNGYIYSCTVEDFENKFGFRNIFN